MVSSDDEMQARSLFLKFPLQFPETSYELKVFCLMFCIFRIPVFPHIVFFFRKMLYHIIVKKLYDLFDFCLAFPLCRLP